MQKNDTKISLGQRVVSSLFRQAPQRQIADASHISSFRSGAFLWASTEQVLAHFFSTKAVPSGLSSVKISPSTSTVIGYATKLSSTAGRIRYVRICTGLTSRNGEIGIHLPLRASLLGNADPLYPSPTQNQ